MIFKLPKIGNNCGFSFLPLLLVSFVYIWYFLVLMDKLGLTVCVFGKSVKMKNRKKL